jgi:uncharacterized protein YneF (UPF0154 family)
MDIRRGDLFKVKLGERAEMGTYVTSEDTDGPPVKGFMPNFWSNLPKGTEILARVTNVGNNLGLYDFAPVPHHPENWIEIPVHCTKRGCNKEICAKKTKPPVTDDEIRHLLPPEYRKGAEVQRIRGMIHDIKQQRPTPGICWGIALEVVRNPDTIGTW